MASLSCTRPTLLERLRLGVDPMAWEEFFHRYGSFVFSIARRRGCSEHTSEEIVQEVMLAIFERKAFFRHDPVRGGFRDWLGGVIRNTVATRRRKASNRGTAPLPLVVGEPQGAEQPEVVWQEAFDQAMLAFLLDVVRRETSPRTYQAFELFTLGECSGDEVARITGLSRNAVYQARKKVLRRLRQLGLEYRDREPPEAQLRAALEGRLSRAVEDAVRTRIERTLPGS